MNNHKALNMVLVMKERDADIRRAIVQTRKDQHGVVALRFTNEAQEMAIEILDEPYDPNVRVFPGED